MHVLRIGSGQPLTSIRLKIGWKWFNDVFFPEIKKRTGRSILLLLDNAPGHFQAFERDNIRVMFFHLNCTSWKQPCDIEIIAAPMKRYRYLYLMDVLDDEGKNRQKNRLDDSVEDQLGCFMGIQRTS